MKKITPFLWYEKDLKGIIAYYTAIFPDMQVHTRGELSDTPSGNVEMATLTILGQELMLMTAGPLFKFTEAISLMITCDTQEEIDYYWTALTVGGGQEGQCGWLKDKYGLSWQVVPSTMEKLLSTGTPEQLARVQQAFMSMKKFDVAALERAAAEN